ncbi:serine dehydratase subunit alpha family protein [Fusobacterium sp. IOR10]|uniref:L-cysteine desulfidase family protein n=1 Tax=Fusobacterium sp. IOR10 TaxID=2665157 RepID=UPI0013D21B73|nr:L-serine ammonia-lyase, iron-sulfur-dependent, subunit alpha [Fusobacterium sp. IOR10]
MNKYADFIKLAKSEMKPSMGCTEPVAIGLAVSNTCRYLEKPATKIKLKISSNIFKNAFCVKLPNTDESGIKLASALGYLLTKENNDMEIFKGVTPELISKAEALVKDNFVEMEAMKDSRFYIEVLATNEHEKVETLTLDRHDNLVKVEKNGEVILNKLENKPGENSTEEKYMDISKFTVKELIEVAETIDVKDLEFLDECINMNLAASEEGLKKDYGMHIGRTIKRLIEEKTLSDDIVNHVKMVTSAAADMRMGGGPFSAMTIAGSGNQGFQTSLPVIAVASYLKLPREKMLRALFISILVMLRMKCNLGRLSPICGGMLGGTAASAGITWLLGGKLAEIKGAMNNMFSSITGMMCDGAKDGCSAKLCSCSGEAVLAAKYSIAGVRASKTDGIVSEKIEDTMDNVARLSNEGMKEIDMTVIDILSNK